MADGQYKIWENLARRMAQRQGLRLEKCRRRDPHAYDYETYQLVTVVGKHGIYASGFETGYGLTLVDVFEILTEEDKQ